MDKKKKNPDVVIFKKRSDTNSKRPMLRNIILILLVGFVILTAVYIVRVNFLHDKQIENPIGTKSNITTCKPLKYTTFNTAYDLASYYKKISEFQKAEDCYKLALNSSLATKKYVQLFDSYIQLGLLVMLKSNQEMALNYLEQAFQVQSQYIPNDRDAFFYATHMKSTIFLRFDRYKEALSLQEQVVAYLKSIGGEKSRLYGSVNLDMGISQTDLALFDKAKASLQEAKSILLPYKEQDEIARLWNAYGVLALKLIDGNMAIEYLSKALDIRAKLVPTNKDDIAETLTNIGTAYEILNNCRTAIVNFKKAEEILISLYGEFGIQLLALKNNIGLCYKKLGNNSASIQYFKSLLKIAKNRLKKPNLTIAKVHANLGVILRRTLEIKKSCHHFKEALNVYQSILGKNHPETISISNKLTQCGII